MRVVKKVFFRGRSGRENKATSPVLKSFEAKVWPLPSFQSTLNTPGSLKFKEIDFVTLQRDKRHRPLFAVMKYRSCSPLSVLNN